MPPPSRSRILILASLEESVLAALQTSSFGPFDPTADETIAPDADAVIVDARRGAPFLNRSAAAAVLVVADDPSPSDVVEWLRLGAQDVIVPGRTKAADWPLRVRVAIERRRLVDEVRRAVGIDLDTGLPDQHQLVEHMSHLMALRAREPAPMALLVLRIEGLASAQARLGREAAQVLKRKLAVRLRAGVRASDVVAALGEDRFGVLLVSMLAPGDALRVAEKLLTGLAVPVHVAGQPLAVSAALGVAHHPADGERPEQLLSLAAAMAAAASAQGRTGFANFAENGPASAANDA
jgi:diguanylate cyclase (GGDEF)-like protein